MSTADITSDVKRLLEDLAPGEKREHVRSAAPTGTEGRFWVVRANGEVAPGSLQWVNDQRRPSYDARFPIVTMEELEQPILQADLEESRVGDFYHVTSSLHLLRSTIVDCIRVLDPEAIEVRKADTRGLGPEWEFYLVMMKRRFDAIDISKTNLTLHNKRVLPNKDFYAGMAHYAAGFCLCEDIPENIHCFVNEYGGQLMFSDELISCLRSAGVRGLHARHPTIEETQVPEIRL